MCLCILEEIFHLWNGLNRKFIFVLRLVPLAVANIEFSS